MHNTKYGDEYLHRELTNGVIKMLCLPFSNAEIERVFSCTTYYKSGRRSGISTELLEAMLYCKFGLEWLGVSLSGFVPPMDMINYSPSILYK